MSGPPRPPLRPLGATAGRVWRTLRHISPSQLAWRARAVALDHGERVMLALASVEASPARLAPRALMCPAALHLPAAASDAELEQYAAGQVVVLGCRMPFRGGEDWWLPAVPGLGRLFQFHLHYHDWLVPLAVRAGTGDTVALEHVVRWLRDWLVSCAPTSPRALRDAWHPYVIATRLAAWGRVLAVAPSVAAADDGRLGEALATSVAQQARRLRTRLERDLRGNHLLRDATGLAWAAYLLDDRFASASARRAAELARAELRQQVLVDGGHVERSPAYHVQAMHDVLDLALILRDDGVAHEARTSLDRMDHWLAAVLHPDGDVPLLNDSSLQGAHELAMLRANVARCLGRTPPAAEHGLVHLTESGLVVHRDSWTTTIVDVGPVGPDWQPGHAHADTLTLELSVGDVRCLVDPGTYGYDADANRSYDRATCTHNCATLDGRDSTEVWSVFRVGARARPIDVRTSVQPPRVTAGHDGLSPATVHRTVSWLGNACQVVDALGASAAATASGGWLVAPGWQIVACDVGAWDLVHADGLRVRVSLSASHTLNTAVIDAPWHPRIGVAQPARRLCWWIGLDRKGSCTVTTHVSWSKSADSPAADSLVSLR
jgi:uncharacterized heparinase superfamily protein